MPVPDDWSTWFDFGYNGVSEGQITVDGLTYDKFSLPEDAIGVTASIQYSDTWKNNKPDYEVTRITSLSPSRRGCRSTLPEESTSI